MSSSSYGADATRLYGWALRAPNSDINSEEPSSFTNVPDSLRLKILLSSGSKKGTQVYFPILSKSRGKRIPLGSPTVALWREIPAYRTFYKSLDLKAVRKERPSMFPKTVPYGNKPIPESYLTCLSMSPVKDPSSRPASCSPQSERCHDSRSLLHSSFKVPGIRITSWFQAPHVKDPYGERCLTRSLYNISSRVPRKGPLHRGLQQQSSTEKEALFLEPLPPSLEVPGRLAPFQVPQRGPYVKRCPSPELYGPQQGIPSSRFPSRSSNRGSRSTSRAPFNHSPR